MLMFKDKRERVTVFSRVTRKNNAKCVCIGNEGQVELKSPNAQTRNGVYPHIANDVIGRWCELSGCIASRIYISSMNIFYPYKTSTLYISYLPMFECGIFNVFVSKFRSMARY